MPVREEAVNSASREPGFGGNAPGGNVLERHVGEQRAGRVENACHGAKAAVLGGLAAIRRDSRTDQGINGRLVRHDQSRANANIVYGTRNGAAGIPAKTGNRS